MHRKAPNAREPSEADLESSNRPAPLSVGRARELFRLQSNRGWYRRGWVKCGMSMKRGEIQFLCGVGTVFDGPLLLRRYNGDVRLCLVSPNLRCLRSWSVRPSRLKLLLSMPIGPISWHASNLGKLTAWKSYTICSPAACASTLSISLARMKSTSGFTIHL